MLPNRSRQEDQPPQIDLRYEDLGSREKIAQAERLVWYPAECDVSIRPGWFYHAAEDGAVKSPETLVDLYFKSVGRNSALLLNLPPDRRGMIHENDVRSLEGMREVLDRTFAVNAAAGSTVTASHTQGWASCCCRSGRRPRDLLDDGRLAGDGRAGIRAGRRTGVQRGYAAGAYRSRAAH